MIGRPKSGLNNKWTYEDCIKVVTRYTDEHISATKLSQVLKERLLGGLIVSCAMVKRVYKTRKRREIIFLRFIRVNH
ncbi:hypothetical protein PT167_02490 [Erysipelothrix rhusiopathiae]|nr:hypothetical protein [Erysipelothrix rhusiopathiae]